MITINSDIAGRFILGKQGLWPGDGGEARVPGLRPIQALTMITSS